MINYLSVSAKDMLVPIYTVIGHTNFFFRFIVNTFLNVGNQIGDVIIFK